MEPDQVETKSPRAPSCFVATSKTKSCTPKRKKKKKKKNRARQKFRKTRTHGAFSNPSSSLA